MTREPEKKNPSFVSRHYWVVLCGLFTAIFVPLMVCDGFLIRYESLQHIESHTISITKLFERDLGLYAPLPEVLSRIDDPKNFNYLDEYVRNMVGFLGLKKVKFFTRDGNLLYPQNPGMTNKKLGDGFKAALGGKIVSKIITRKEYLREYGEDIPVDLGEVYLPIRDWQGKVQFVMETYYETSEIMAIHRPYMWYHSISLGVPLAGILTVLGFIYRKEQSLEIKIETLESILPICVHCKKIRVEKPGEPNRWVAVETFFRRKDELEFSHGVCNDCLKLHYPGNEDLADTGRNPGA